MATGEGESAEGAAGRTSAVAEATCKPDGGENLNITFPSRNAFPSEFNLIFSFFQEQIRIEREDIALQREQLYRKLEAVSSQGLVNAANPPLLTSPQLTSPQPPNATTSPSSLLLDLSSPTSSLPAASSSSPSDSWKRRNDSVRWKQSSAPSANMLPLNLISATNQQKVSIDSK